MRLKKISFANYKVFESFQEFEIAPITILIGKNSTGKSALVRLIKMLNRSFKDNDKKGSPIVLNSGSIDLGNSISDIVYKNRDRSLHLKVDFELPNLVIDFKIRGYSITSVNKLDYIFENYTIKTDSKEYLFELDIDYLDKNNKVKYKFSDDVNLVSVDFNNLIPLIKDKEIIPNRMKREWDVQYITPLRAIGKRLYEMINKDFDEKGENIPSLLFQNKKLLYDVGDWYHKNMKINGVKIREISGRYFEMITNDGINFVDLGLGIMQSLPIVTMALRKEKNTLNIIEQPELHLHPAAHGNIAELLAISCKEEQTMQYIIETHSENFILRLRRLIAEGEIPKELLKIYWIDYNENKQHSDLKEIKVDDLGRVDYWPEGVFSESFEETKALRLAQRKKQG